MIISISKARKLGRAYLATQDGYDLSKISLHYLGIYHRRRAFEVDFTFPDGLCVDLGLPVILIVAAKEVHLIQSELSYEIIDYFNAKKK